MAMKVPSSMPCMFLWVDWAPTTATPVAPVSMPGAFCPSHACARSVERELLVAGKAAQHDGHARGRPFDIDEIVEVAADRQGKLVEQQILRGEVGVVGKNVERRIVAMQVPVQPLHDVGDGEDMGDFRLRPVPLDERIHPFQVVDIGYAALPPGAQRVFVSLHAGEVFADEIGGPAELVALVEKLEPVLLEFDPRNAGYEHDDQDAERTEQDRPAQNDEPRRTGRRG